MDEIRELIALNGALFGALGFFLGLLVGHRMQLGRDRRKEYLDVVRPIRARLIEFRGARVPSLIRLPSAHELDLLNFHLWPVGRHRLRRALDRYESDRKQQSIQQPNTKFDDKIFADADAMARAVDRILAALPHR